MKGKEGGSYVKDEKALTFIGEMPSVEEARASNAFQEKRMKNFSAFLRRTHTNSSSRPNSSSLDNY